MKIEDLGFNIFFESARDRLGFNHLSVARVVAERRGAYSVLNAKGEFTAKITGKRMFEASSREEYPAIGDWVTIVESDNKTAVIQNILPRQTILKRSSGDKTQIIATNIDVAFIVESVDRDYNLNRFERYFVIAVEGGVKPVIILNKIDLMSEDELNKVILEINNRFNGVDIIKTSTLSNVGLDELKARVINGKTYCFLGSSGVGKSSLINHLIKGDVVKIKTAEVGSRSNRGKHVTTSRQMYFLDNGGIVIDNPGIREVGLANTSDVVKLFFDEITNLGLNCQYADCTHTHEPDCAVIKAVSAGNLDKDKYSNYLNLKKEADYYQMNNYEKREKGRKFGKFLKNAKKDFDKF